MDREKWRSKKIIILILGAFLLQGCSLATEGKSLNDTQDELIGAWAVLEKSPQGTDEIDLEGFKKEDAHVVYLDITIEDGARTAGAINSGSVYGGALSLTVGESLGTDLVSEVYFTTTSPKTVKLIPIYQKPNGERYAIDEQTWMVIEPQVSDLEEPLRKGEDSLGAMTLTNSYEKTEDGRKIENTTRIEVDFVKKEDLKEAKLIHLDENFDVVFEEEVDFKKLSDQESPVKFDIRENAHMVVVEEMYTNFNTNETYLVRSIYSAEQGDEITHDFILPVENDLAKKETIEFMFKK